MRGRALEYARGFGRGIALDDADKFVSMYVNEMTRDMGERGRLAVGELIQRGVGAGLLPKGARVSLAPED
jgi:1,4-dihydroxy-6-naphthoate synthase